MSMESPANIKSNWKYFFVIIFCIGIVYARTLSFDFVNYDDYDLVFNNESFISNPLNIGTAFSTHAFTTHRKESVYYRPILLTSYIIDYQIWKLNPLGYHLTNILLHCLAAILVFLLINSLTQNRIVALLSSLLFALHPIQVESVAWVAGRNDVLVGLFITMMMYFYIRQYEIPEKKKSYLLLTGLSFTMAIFTKETAVFCILLLPLYDVVIRKISFASLFTKESLVKFVPFVVVLGIYLTIRLLLFGEIAGTEKLYGALSFIGRFKILPAILMEYLSFLIAPIRLSIEHPLDKIIWLEPIWYPSAIAGIILLIIIYWWTRRHDSILFFGLLWLVICIFPALNIFPLAVPVLEHRLYMASIGFVLVVCYGLSHIIKTHSQNFWRIPVILLITACGVSSAFRLPVWQNSETLWLDAIEKAPTAHRSYFNLAGEYFDHQQYEKTIELLNKYIELKPEDFIGYSKLRQTYFAARKYDKAIEVCKRMIVLDPREQNRYTDLGLFFERLNLPDSAVNIYQEGLHVDSTFYQLYFYLGRIYWNKGNSADAEKHFGLAIQFKSDYAPAYFGLGALKASAGNDTLALKLLEQGAKYEKPSADISQMMTYLRGKIVKQGKLDE